MDKPDYPEHLRARVANYPKRVCPTCKKPMYPKLYPDGKLEVPVSFAAKKACSVRCSSLLRVSTAEGKVQIRRARRHGKLRMTAAVLDASSHPWYKRLESELEAERLSGQTKPEPTIAELKAAFKASLRRHPDLFTALYEPDVSTLWMLT